MNLPDINEEEFQELDHEIERNIANAKTRKNAPAKEGEDTSAPSGDGLDLSEDLGLPKDTLSSVEGTIDGITDVINGDIPTTKSDCTEGTGYLPVTCESLGIDPLNAAINASSAADAIKEDDRPEDQSEVTPEVDIELYYDDLDDKELDSYLLSAEESKRKALIWTASYGAFMEQKAAKQRLRQEEKEKIAANGRKRKSAKPKEEGYARPTKKLKSDRPAATANEAIDQIIKQKNISEKINIDVLKNLRIEKPVATSNSTVASTESQVSNNKSKDSFSEQLLSGKITSRLASAFRKGAPPKNSSSPSRKGATSTAPLNGPLLKPSLKKPLVKEFDMFASSSKT